MSQIAAAERSPEKAGVGAVDVSHMKRSGVELDNHTYMSNPENANRVLATLSPQGGESPGMPPGGPYWTPANSRYSRDGRTTVPAVTCLFCGEVSRFGVPIDWPQCLIKPLETRRLTGP